MFIKDAEGLLILHSTWIDLIRHDNSLCPLHYIIFNNSTELKAQSGSITSISDLKGKQKTTNKLNFRYLIQQVVHVYFELSNAPINYFLCEKRPKTVSQ